MIGVKPAYAQNFVIAKGLGKMATPDVLAQVEADKAAAIAAAIAAKEAAEALKTKLEEVFGRTLTLTRSTDPDPNPNPNPNPNQVFGATGAVIKKKVGPSPSV